MSKSTFSKLCKIAWFFYIVFGEIDRSSPRLRPWLEGAEERGRGGTLSCLNLMAGEGSWSGEPSKVTPTVETTI
jgi:hypothetical protein